MNERKKSPRGASFPKEPVIRGGESTASIQMRMGRYYHALRQFWKSNGIDVQSTETTAQCERLAAILRLQGSRGLGSLEGRAAGGFVQLPTRISDLKEDGFDIASIPENKHGGDGLFHMRTARYVLISEPKRAAA
ncbi:hypothetical protein HHL24_17100 [Paraburkholderia sp. RP-4-7]|uniref:Winged helix-turn-helix domain-containing protein n=1 Tax=Paraburkholderia polaris TaxID=2728848 RepID=A0A848IJT1_9BURK|nr:helix-turn-helix domain-containing protein [Paraburkholderia polaris]NML99646.1 hypothetical protein [Paraburkholderia polaris]